MSAPTESVLAARPRLTGHRAFALYWCARTATAGAYQMQAVAIGWQIYELTGSALDLGLVGLVQFVPIVVLSPLIGQAADHFDRRALARTCQIVKALVAAALAFATFSGLIGRDGILALLFVTGTARAFETPTLHALLPALVPAPLLPRAIAAAATANQTAIICGPALGGLLYALGATAVYGTCTVVFLAASILVSLLPRPPRQTGEWQPVSFATVFAGFAYIREKPVLLGAVSLDLFAVLLGGVTALLPIYARDILHAGPWALGLLRSAPAVGALAVSIVLAHRAIAGRAGHVMFAAVGLFGVASVLFGLSTSIGLSFLALVIYGASDAVSVVIRQSLVQMRTPHDMLGRVMAVNSMFTGSSGSLGEFRAGAIAAWLGAVPSALIGGVGTIAVMLIWMWTFPQLRRVDKLSPDAGPVP
jgi:MFS family permease